MNPEIHVLAGGNGAGKSTFHRLVLADLKLPFVNADRIEARLGDGRTQEDKSVLAGRIAWEELDSLIERQRSIVYETVFSHPSKLELLRRCRTEGYRVIPYYVTLSVPELHEARVVLGSEAGERHYVDPSKIAARLERLKSLVVQTLEIADEAFVFDNSSATEPFRLVDRFRDGERVDVHDP